MSPTACNNRGITIVEVLITLFLTAVGIMALLSMQPTSWSAAGRSDFMGRAAGILQSELERSELWIMNPNNAFATACDATGRNLFLGGPCTRTINASSQSAQQAGDVPYTVATTVTPLAGATNAWTVRIQVTWPGNTRGITESTIVSRQEYFRQ
ncbi:MAG TPA: prepilin-type N-terminal cleavage/methylation domain-containing protein [Syntrophales bacterium]|nr:prepilin-type N-terminal cleavage/methylation domain-containing protein [Syntrophales bacterium]HNS53809.1 prepilin-type N-terminal cleavage/methylation domain-containing protein [Syntrophales bacterium]HQL90547.1 prepilin-type N-terminal cleavage/methylation domain-containing protein [Syntrophales bacterium]